MLSYVVLAAVLILQAQGFKDGAPNGGVCQTLVPKHDDAVPQKSTSPYNLWIDQGTVKSSPSGTLGTPSSVKVTLRHNDNTTPFKGFLIQARSADQPDKIIGTWTTVDNKISKTIDCSGAQLNAVTHTINEPKTSVTALWTPPSDYKGKVVIRATVVQDYTTIWADFKSLPINVV